MVVDLIIEQGALLINGIGLGLLWALLGLTITLVFGLGGILNMAIGVFSIIGLLLTIELNTIMPLIPAAIIAIIVTSAIGLVIERSVFPLVYRSEGDERMMLGIFVTLGISILIQGLLVLNYTGRYSISHGMQSISVGDTFIRGGSVVIIAVSLVIFFLLYLFFNRTYLGMATRTIMQDETGALLCGIDTKRLRTLVFVLSITVAASIGVLYGLNFKPGVAKSFHLTVTGVIVAIVGGITNITNVVVAGVALGILTTFISAYLGSYLSSISLFGAAVVVLVLKPEGLQ